MTFSYFTKDIHSKRPSGQKTLKEVYDMITTDMLLKQTTLELRAGIRKKEKDLPFITPSGLFKGRKLTDLVTYTGILCIDLDDMTDLFVCDKLRADSRFPPCLIFISPSGSGVKLFYRIPGALQEDHQLYYRALIRYLNLTYGIAADEVCHDIPRTCFLCHDAGAYYADATVSRGDLLSFLSSLCTDHDGTEAVPPPVREAVPASPGNLISDLKNHPSVHSRAVQALCAAGWKNSFDRYWIRPGKEKGTSATYEPDETGCYRFKNYSLSAPDFAVDKSYDDIGIIAILEYSGDNSRCIRELAAELGLSCQTETRPPGWQGRDLPSGEDYFDDNDIAAVLEQGAQAREQRKIGGAFLYEDTTTYIFSRTNYGKSLLVFQLAYAAATGTSIDPCSALQNNCGPMKVLVVDLELEPRVLFKRHGLILRREEPLLKNLRYLHEKMDKSVSTGLNLLDKIERYAVKHQAQLVIIDNISKLLPDSLKPEVVTQVIDALNKIRKRTGASMLVIGHTIKGNPRIAIQPTDYFGSSMVQNFFAEVSYLDMTADGRFFLCQSKTKQKECYNETVPVFTRCEHPVVGVGFNYEGLLSISDVQLPLVLQVKNNPKKRNLKNYLKEISILDHNGVSRAVIAEMLGVSRPTIYNLFDP